MGCAVITCKDGGDKGWETLLNTPLRLELCLTWGSVDADRAAAMWKLAWPSCRRRSGT